MQLEEDRIFHASNQESTNVTKLRVSRYKNLDANEVASFSLRLRALLFLTHFISRSAGLEGKSSLPP